MTIDFNIIIKTPEAKLQQLALMWNGYYNTRIANNTTYELRYIKARALELIAAYELNTDDLPEMNIYPIEPYTFL